MTSPDAAPEPTPVAPATVAPAPVETAPVAPAPVAPPPVTPEDGSRGASAARGVAAREPVLPEQSLEDTDAGWGEYSARDDDRLYRDRPPHWDDV
jgi:hypothetical protein